MNVHNEARHGESAESASNYKQGHSSKERLIFRPLLAWPGLCLAVQSDINVFAQQPTSLYNLPNDTPDILTALTCISVQCRDSIQIDIS